MRLPFKKYLPYSYVMGLLVIAFLIRIYLFSRKKEDATALDIYNILQIAITFLLSLVLLVRRDTYFIFRILLRTPVSWLILLYGFGIISGIWSALPLFSPYFGFEGLVYIIALSLILYWQANGVAYERFAINASYLFIILMLAGLIKNNGISLSLFHWHANNYTTIAAMLFGYCFGEYNNSYRELGHTEKRVLKRGIWIGLFFVFLGTSSASNISLLTGLIAVVLVTARRSVKIISLIFFLGVLLANQLYGEWVYGVIFPGKDPENLGMLTGRMNLWESYFELIRQKPWAGWGFASLSRISGLYNIHTHNSFVEIVGGVGYIGLIIFLIYIFRFYYKLLSNIRSPYLVGVAGAVTAGLVNSNAISFIGAPIGALFFSFIIWNILGFFTLINPTHDISINNENYLGDS